MFRELGKLKDAERLLKERKFGEVLALVRDPEVRDHDPVEALYGGSIDGLALPLAMAARAAELLRDGGTLVMEHAETQGAALPRALAGTGDWDRVIDHVDLLGRPRCVVASRHRVRGRDVS